MADNEPSAAHPPIQPDIAEFFATTSRSLEDIEAAGWTVRTSMSGDWWFVNRHTHRRFFLPLWVRELVHDANREGAELVKSEFRKLLGITPQRKKRGAE